MLLEGLYVSDDKIKLGAFLERYLKDVAAHNLRPKSLAKYKGIIDNHIKPELGSIKLASLRPEQVQAMYSKKLNEGVSAHTVKYTHAVLHKALNQALKWSLVTRNVSDLVEKPRIEIVSQKTWTVEEVKLFLEAVFGHRWYPIYTLAISTGMRQGEILGLAREDIDLEKRIINVRHQVSEITGQGVIITEPKSEKSKRPITLPSIAVDALRNHFELMDEKAGLIFTTSRKKPISPSNVGRHFRSVSDQLGLKKIRFHDLRHTHATLLLTDGTHPKIVQERLGHSQISLTLDTYSHVIPSMQEEVADQFDAILG